MLDNLESQILSRVKKNFSERIKKNYPDLNFTTSDKTPTKAKFPTVYIHFMESPEGFETLDGISLNGIDPASFQVDVTDNQSNNRTDEVAWEVFRVMKSMRFKAKPAVPFHNNNGSTYCTTARYRRTIGSGEVL